MVSAHGGINLWSGGINLYGGELKFFGGVIFVTTLSLFHLFRNSYHPEKSSASFMNSFRNGNASGVAICRYPQIY